MVLLKYADREGKKNIIFYKRYYDKSVVSRFHRRRHLSTGFSYFYDDCRLQSVTDSSIITPPPAHVSFVCYLLSPVKIIFQHEIQKLVITKLSQSYRYKNDALGRRSNQVEGLLFNRLDLLRRLFCLAGGRDVKRSVLT